MTLVRFSPMRSLWRSPNRLDRIFDSFFDGFETEMEGGSTGWLPRVDVKETADALVLSADLPGLDKNDIHLSVEDNRLTIHGERKIAREDKGADYHRVERRSGMFARSFTLPATVQSDRIEASYKEGVLEVSIPKAEEMKPREIKIMS